MLNRSIHVPKLVNESGYQLDLFYTFPASQILTVNMTRTQNKLHKKFIFYEYFIELYTTVFKKSTLQVFADFSKDEIAFEKDRMSTGFSYSNPVYKDYSVAIAVEAQKFVRDFSDGQNVENYYGSLTFSKSPDFSGSFIFEITTDPVLTDRIDTKEAESGKRYYAGVNLNYKPHAKHTLNLFAGERRGGPACTSGICYEVIDFKGVEMRLTSSF